MDIYFRRKEDEKEERKDIYQQQDEREGDLDNCSLRLKALTPCRKADRMQGDCKLEIGLHF